MRRRTIYLLAGLVAGLTPGVSSAALLMTPAGSLVAQSGTITFTQSEIGSYGSVGFSTPTASLPGLVTYFGSYFAGQTPRGADPVIVAEPSAPGQPLQLRYDNDDYIEIVDDQAAGGPVVAGGPLAFRQPVSLLFSSAVPGVQLTVGYLDQAGSLDIAGYDALGNELGTVTNTMTGFETIDLTDPGGPGISGLTIQSSETSGFGVNNVFVGTPAAVAVAEPSSLAVLLAGLAVVVWTVRRRRA